MSYLINGWKTAFHKPIKSCVFYYFCAVPPQAVDGKESFLHRILRFSSLLRCLKALLLLHFSLSLPPAQAILYKAKELNQKEFAVYVNELFDKWLAAGAESKSSFTFAFFSFSAACASNSL
mgnify:CR=1 FL=1